MLERLLDVAYNKLQLIITYLIKKTQQQRKVMEFIKINYKQ